MIVKICDEENYFLVVVFRNEITFYLSETINRQSVRIWGLQNPYISTDYVKDNPKVNVFCALSLNKIYWSYV